jgi:hypothetical protein
MWLQDMIVQRTMLDAGMTRARIYMALACE